MPRQRARQEPPLEKIQKGTQSSLAVSEHEDRRDGRDRVRTPHPHTAVRGGVRRARRRKDGQHIGGVGMSGHRAHGTASAGTDTQEQKPVERELADADRR